MKSLRKAYRAKGVHLSALFLTLFFSLASLVSCTQPEPLFTSINLGIPAAALQSPVKGKLPDSTELNVGITFKIDPRLLNQAIKQITDLRVISSEGRNPCPVAANEVRHPPVQGPDILRACNSTQSTYRFRPNYRCHERVGQLQPTPQARAGYHLSSSITPIPAWSTGL